ncbi:MAG: AsmA-like C-terminal region-containing protein [Saprospiraceae bacterium]
MTKSIRYIVRITAGFFLFLISLCVIMYLLVITNKDVIKTMARAQINKQVKGTVHIGDLKLNFIRTFPNVSVQLSDITLRDSLWDRHHHNILQAEKIYTRFEILSLFRGKPKISGVIIQNCTIYLFTDECGYCNLNRSDDLAFKKGKADFPDFKFDHTRLIVENKNLNSYHDIDIDILNCHVDAIDSGFVFNVRMNSLVHSVGFNMDKGSYLKEKPLEGNFDLIYYPGKKVECNEIQLIIDQQPFVLNGNIYFLNDTLSYAVNIRTKKILYQKAEFLLTQSLQQKLNPLDILQPFDVDADISGLAAPNIIPRIATHFVVHDSEMKTPAGGLSQCSFTGNFTNQMNAQLLPGDENSKFIFDSVQYTWENITFTSNHTEISNLLSPYLICDLRSNFKLEDLNALTESSSIRFIKGLGSLDINYNGSFAKEDTLNSLVNGTLTLSEAEVNYIPRNLVFKRCSGVLTFKDEDLVISHFIATAGSTNLTMNGEVTNLLALLNKNPEQLTMNWTISTPDLNLNDFISFVSERAIVPRQKPAVKNKLISATENIDRMLSDGTARLNISAGKMTYKKFTASNVAASIFLVGNKVVLRKVKLNHAGGSLNLQGSLTNGIHSNLLVLTSTLENVDIPGIFHAFDNFGQDAITAQNMKGNLSAKINITGVITDKAEVYPNSMKGKVEFSVKEGELINFDPAVKIAATAFKKRDFSHIFFGELTNELELNGSAITIHKMEIRSNVVILFVEGVYDTRKGTDMSIQVPLSNLSKSENAVLENTGRVGMNIRLRAKTGDDGKLKVNWDPFNKASKQRKQESRQDSLKSPGPNKK